MAFTGWFPHFSPSGANLVTGTGELWINKTQNVGFGYQGVPSATRGWFNETTILFMSTPTGTDVGYGIWSCTVGGSRQNLGITANFYQLVVASGRWAGWDGSITTSWGQSVTSDYPRAPALSSTHFAYLLDGNLSTQRLMLDGVQIDNASIIDPMMSEQGLCWVRLGPPRQVWGKRLDVPGAIANVGASSATEYQAIPIDTPTGPWILSYDSARLILRPWGSTTGYVVATGETMYPMGVYTTAGLFRIAWSSSTGTYGEAFINPSDTRVALGGTSDPVDPGETDPGNPGAQTAIGSMRPPIRHPLVDPTTGLVTPPWALWFENQASAEAANVYGYVPANTLVGRGPSGPGPASTITVGTGLVIRDNTLMLE